MKLLRFRLYGSFAHFNQPIGNRYRNTYSTIPKPQLLGLLGAVVGFSGYKNSETYPEYYRELKDLMIYIKPNTNANKVTSVTYNSMNSFLNNRVNPEKNKDGKITAPQPNVIIHEQVLLEPDYEIGLLVDPQNVVHNNLIESIQYNYCVFPIYLGKNEFFANIEYISLEDYEINSDVNVKCRSILPFDELDGEGTGNMKLEHLPICFDSDFKYVYKLMAIPQNGCNVPLKNPENCIVAGGEIYYVF